MAVWSSIARMLQGASLPARSIGLGLSQKCTSPVMQGALLRHVRDMSGHGPRIMPLTPSRWQWHKFKDMLHFYVMLGVIPAGLGVFYANVFIGPATLAEIPEDYEPKHWEYYKHPIQRWLARYIFPSHQQEYEKYMHYLFEEDEKAQIRRLEQKIRAKMSERQDYQAYYYRPAIAKYHRVSKEAAEYLQNLKGD